jgi:hypothetical protein
VQGLGLEGIIVVTLSGVFLLFYDSGNILPASVRLIWTTSLLLAVALGATSRVLAPITQDTTTK